jgi:hypothetical protein
MHSALGVSSTAREEDSPRLPQLRLAAPRKWSQIFTVRTCRINGMRKIAALTLIFSLVIPTLVNAETWTARVAQLNCGHQVNTLTFTLVNNTLTVTNKYGQLFSTAVPADGVIKKTYNPPYSPLSMRTFEMTGSVKSREFEVLDIDRQCRYKVTPQA